MSITSMPRAPPTALYHVNIHDAHLQALPANSRSGTTTGNNVRESLFQTMARTGQSEMAEQRIGNYEAFKEYQRAVFDRPAPSRDDGPRRLRPRIIALPYLAEVADTYSAPALARRGSPCSTCPSVGTTSIGLRHMGEIELARGFLASATAG